MEKKRGRPKKPKRERRVKPLRIPLTDDERGTIDGAAKRQAMDTATWARGILLTASVEPG